MQTTLTSKHLVYIVVYSVYTCLFLHCVPSEPRTLRVPMVDEWGAAVVGGSPVRATGEAGGTPEAPEAEAEARGGAEYFLPGRAAQPDLEGASGAPRPGTLNNN